MPTVARVVPAVPSFSVDGGFRYSIPDGMRSIVEVGSLVRVPLGGRRVRGYVVATADEDASGLRQIATVSGGSTVFDDLLLSSLRWAAHHYVAPLSVMLERAAPPNNPPAPSPAVAHVDLPIVAGHRLSDLVDVARAGRRHRPVVLLESEPDPALIARFGADLVNQRAGLMIVVATVPEAQRLFAVLEEHLGDAVVLVHGEMGDRDVTSAWATSRHTPAVLVGTPRVAGWKQHGLAACVVVQDGRRAMKDRQTPTVHIREMLATRAKRECFTLVFSSPTPSVEVMASGPDVRRSPGRIWPLVEVADRREQAPGSGLLTETVRQALRSVTARGGRTFVYAHRRGYAAAMRCVACRTVRRCPTCGSRPDPGSTCSRCGGQLGPCAECGAERFEPLGAGVGRLVQEVGRIVGPDQVAPFPSDSPVSVGTERDLAALGMMDLIVLTDLDGLLFGVDYRAGEETLRIAARLAGRVGRGTGRRLIVQTAEPTHPVVVALKRADPIPALNIEIDTRSALGYPPAGQLLVMEARGPVDITGVTAHLSSIADGLAILGPAPISEGARWLVQGHDLWGFKRELRSLVQRLRDGGVTIRIDADPIDL